MKTFLTKLFVLQILGMCSLIAQVRLEIFRGSEILHYTPELAKISLIANKDYPCFACFHGMGDDPEYSLTQYAQSNAAILCLAYEGCTIVGFTIGAPLRACLLFFPSFCFSENFDVDRLFYIGEISLLSGYRKEGIAREMCLLVEKVIRCEQIYLGIDLVSMEDRGRDFSFDGLSSHFCENMGYKRWPYRVRVDSYQGFVHRVKMLENRGLQKGIWETQFSIPNSNGEFDFY